MIHCLMDMASRQYRVADAGFIFSYPLAFDAPVRGVPVGISLPRFVWKTRMVWLPGGEKKLKICLFVVT